MCLRAAPTGKGSVAGAGAAVDAQIAECRAPGKVSG